MRVHVIVTNALGKTFEGNVSLAASNGTSQRRRRVASVRKASLARAHAKKPNFSLPIRAFVRRYAKNLSGPQKFTALVAKLAKGKAGVAISLKDVEKRWNQMTHSLGSYNGAHSSRAKDNGWVDSPKRSFYVLVPGWTDALNDK
jgi:site-specific DNA-cytosine methylase